MERIAHWLRSVGYANVTAESVLPLGAGMFSRAYRFDTDKGVYVLRIGVTQEAFEKDRLVYERLGRALPIPKVISIGRYDPAHVYCITDWYPGQILTALSPDETSRLLPSLFANLLTMSQVPVPVDSGFGILNGKGQARRQYAGWPAFIGAVDDFPLTFTPRGDEVYKSWRELFSTTSLEEPMIRDARRRLDDLLPYLPNARHYVHGDFGYDNVLAQDGELTAILDWAELRCGDWLYDLAYVAWHDEQGIDYIGAFRRWADGKSLTVPNLTERIQAYYLSIFLGGIFLGANRGMWDWYAEDVARYKIRILSA